MRHHIDAAEVKLAEAGVDDPRREAEMLMADVSGLSRAQIISELDEFDFNVPSRERFEAFVERRAAREPFAYITRRKGFRKIVLEVDPHVLIPRPETELLVDVVIDRGPTTVLEVGTGSGAIALSLAEEAPEMRIDAVDISLEAVEIATMNMEALWLDDLPQCRFFVSDLLEAVDGAYDCIVANLPYVPSGEIAGLQPEIADHEPVSALDGGTDGLDVVRRLVAQAPTHIEPGGLLALEIGDGQGEATAQLLCDAGFADVEVHLDLAEKERVVSGTWP